jgi:orotate phosphoribosyltransferase
MSQADRTDFLDVFRASGALLEGHFRLSSGLHSNGYLQCALVLQHPKTAAALAERLAATAAAWAPDAVLSPALGGVVIGHEMARALGVRAMFAERQDRALVLRRGFAITPGERILVVEDVVTTGLSTRETMEVARAAGAVVVGAASLVNRSGGRADVGVPLVSLVAIDLPTWEESACPLCAQGVPVVKPGSRPAAGR